MHHSWWIAWVVVTISCGGSVRLATQERPDEAQGLPPPSDFEVCRASTNTTERVDTNHNGKPDAMRVLGLDGVEVCHGSDSNENGRFDTWEELDHGRVVRRARDTDENGFVDEVTLWPDPARPDCPVVFNDLDGDGKPEHVKVDICGISKRAQEK